MRNIIGLGISIGLISIGVYQWNLYLIGIGAMCLLLSKIISLLNRLLDSNEELIEAVDSQTDILENQRNENSLSI